MQQPIRTTPRSTEQIKRDKESQILPLATHFSTEELRSLKDCFDSFRPDQHGQVKTVRIRESFKSNNFDTSNPTMFKQMDELYRTQAEVNFT
jgi:Ca2+-binding EF-hand superfamily protein